MEIEQTLVEHPHSEHHHHHHEPHPQVDFHLNNKPVHMHGHSHTGLQVKEAAIAQGVKIHPDFLLYLLRHHQPNQPIGDHEEVRITHETRFHAIADDDNS